MDLPTAARLIVSRGRSMEQTGNSGGMLAVGVAADAAEDLIRDYRGRVGLAAVKSPSLVTLSGDRDALEEIARRLGEEVFHRFLPIEYAFHSHHMDAAREGLLASLEGLELHWAGRRMVSTVTGDWVEGPELDVEYWWRNIRQPVRFAEAVSRLAQGGCGTFVEISPHPVLSSAVLQCLYKTDKGGAVVPTLRRQEDERREMLISLGSLYCLGHGVDWRSLYPQGRPLRLPGYPWQHGSYWNEAPNIRKARLGEKSHPLLGRRLNAAEPVWQVELGKQNLSYLWDHIVQNHVLFPAAGYLEIGLAVAKEIYGHERCVLEEVDLHRAMFIPDSAADRAVLQTVFDPGTSAYRVYGRSGASDAPWSLLASGTIRSQPPAAEDGVPAGDWCFSGPAHELSHEELYQICHERSFQYGPTFRGVQRCWRRDGEAARGRIQAPEPIRGELGHYRTHPAVVDAGFQLLIHALSHSHRVRKHEAVLLPVHIDRVVHRGVMSEALECSVRLAWEGQQGAMADYQYRDESGQVVLELAGFRVQFINTMQQAQSEGVQYLTYETEWQLAPLAASEPQSGPVDFLPAPSDFATRLRDEAIQIPTYRWMVRYQEVEADLDAVCGTYVLRALRELGWNPDVGQRIRAQELAEGLRIAPEHHRLLDGYLKILAEDGWLESADGGWVVCRRLEPSDARLSWRRALHGFPAYCSELSLMARCGERLAQILRGETDPLEVVFPGGSLDTADHFYQDSPTFKFCNQVMGRAVALALERLPEGRTVRVLEIGGGTAATAAYVLPQLPAGRSQYVFSDVSPVFFSKAKQKLTAYPFVRYEALDIELDPESQGFTPHSFDLVLATDVLHATRELRSSLCHVRRLLAPQGLFLLTEVDRPLRWYSLVFGLIKGWWRFADTDLRPDSPLLSRDRWQQVLGEAGFRDPLAIADTDLEKGPSHTLFLCRAPQADESVADALKAVPGQAEESATPPAGAPQEKTPAPTPAKDLSGRWLVFADGHGIAHQVAAYLRARGGQPILVCPAKAYSRAPDGEYSIDPGQPEHFRRLLDEAVGSDEAGLKGVLHCWSLDCLAAAETTVEGLRRAEELTCHSLLHFVQAWTQRAGVTAPWLWLITSGAQAVGQHARSFSVAQSPLYGVGRTIANEYPQFGCRMVDLSPDPSADDVHALCAELGQPEESDELEIALRGRARYVPRVVRKSLTSFSDDELKRVDPRVAGFRLETAAPGVLDRLVLRETPRRDPGPGEVEIQVLAAGLNFRDVLKALGIHPPIEGDEDLWFGDECAARITAVGPGVDGLRVGDEVLTVSLSCFSSFLTLPAFLVIRKPAHLGLEEAATIPIAFLTACHALHTLGRMAADERVLIHAATGGVGLAAVQLAQEAGAEVFATAGTPEKRAFLRALGVEHVMDSRSLSFGDEVRRKTGGRGVDLVLNSLAGQAIGQGLACLAPHGRFLEIGKRDIYQNSRLGLRPFKNNISFFAIDIRGMIRERPAVIASIWSELARLFDQRRLHPLPFRVFPVGDVAGAFRYMALARHIGKLIVSFQEPEVRVEPQLPGDVTCAADATYLITGGLGGFGLAIARWLAQRGARHLLLLGRRGAASAEAQETIAGLEAGGIRVVVAQADVACASDVTGVLRQVRETMPPLRGVVHAAMVLDDGILVKLDAERFRRVMEPKVQGAWNLHQLTRDLPLDFFVCFSSFAAMVGNPGQGNYAAANAFLDLLSHHRRSLGLPALTVDWGRLTDVGYVTRHQGLTEHFERLGERGISSSQATHILGRLLSKGSTQVMVMNADWPQFAKVLFGRPPARFSRLLGRETDELASSNEVGRIRDLVLAAPADDRPQLLRSYLAEALAGVLGTSAAEMDPDTPLNELGLDSLMTVELKNRIEQEAGVSLPTMELMRGPSLSKLAQLVLEQISGPTAAAGTRPAPQIRPAPPQADEAHSAESLLEKVDQMSEEEVDKLLAAVEDKDDAPAAEEPFAGEGASP
jgi:acyl transferase domain-containing protein/SAM-dependent methyltransferase/acyl carrier protein